MIPNPQQDILLRKYLREVLQYRETYEEVYDHIITALEQNAFAGTLEEAVNHILRVDFGGYNQLKKMDNRAKSAAVKDGVMKFLQYPAGFLKWPRLPFTLGFAVLVYFTLAQIKLQLIGFEALFALLILTPAILSLRRYYVVGYVFKDTKKSVYDEVFARISMVPTRLIVFFGIAICINISKGKDIWQNVTPATLTVVYVLSAIYLLSLVKLYRNEFKISLTA